MKLLQIVPVLFLFLATSAYSANRYLSDQEIDRLEKRFDEQLERKEQGIVDHPNDLSLMELDDLSYHYDHRNDSDYNICWETEHDPNNDMLYYIREDGIYVPKGWGWGVVVCGFVSYLSGWGQFLFFAAFFALVDENYTLLALYAVYGGGLGWIVQMIIWRFS